MVLNLLYLHMPTLKMPTIYGTPNATKRFPNTTPNDHNMERQMRQKDSLIQPRTICVFWNGLRVSERFHERSRERSRERSAERFHEFRAYTYGTPNETKISKRKRQQIVSESSFDVAVDYDFDLVIEYDFDLPIEYEFVYHDSITYSNTTSRSISQWYNLGAQGARKDHFLAGAFITPSDAY